MPAELDEMNRRIMQLQIEEAVPEEGDRRALQSSAWPLWKRRLAELRDSFNSNEGQVGEREERHQQGAKFAC